MSAHILGQYIMHCDIRLRKRIETSNCLSCYMQKHKQKTEETEVIMIDSMPGRTADGYAVI